MQFSIVAASVCIPTNSARTFLFKPRCLWTGDLNVHVCFCTRELHVDDISLHSCQTVGSTSSSLAPFSVFSSLGKLPDQILRLSIYFSQYITSQIAQHFLVFISHKNPLSVTLLSHKNMILVQVFIYAFLQCFFEGNGIPLQYTCLENAMDRGAWQAAVHGAAKSQT